MAERFLNLKTQNFAVKWISENRFNFIQKNSEWAINKQKKIDENGKIFHLGVCYGYCKTNISATTDQPYE